MKHVWQHEEVPHYQSLMSVTLETESMNKPFFDIYKGRFYYKYFKVSTN
jgi:hypothetical protein